MVDDKNADELAVRVAVLEAKMRLVTTFLKSVLGVAVAAGVAWITYRLQQ